MNFVSHYSEKSSAVDYADYLKEQCHKIFCLWFFHKSVSPQPQSIPVRPYQICLKIRGDIRKSRCTDGINDTGGKFVHHFASIVDTGGKQWEQ